ESRWSRWVWFASVVVLVALAGAGGGWLLKSSKAPASAGAANANSPAGQCETGRLNLRKYGDTTYRSTWIERHALDLAPFRKDLTMDQLRQKYDADFEQVIQEAQSATDYWCQEPRVSDSNGPSLTTPEGQCESAKLTLQIGSDPTFHERQVEA